jgi:putative PIN family toxin of toxin-antitoxin system
MTRRVAVIDTNVVVSGLISKEGDSPAARILDGMLAVKFRYLLSPDLLVEYRNVLLRPRIGKLHTLGTEEIDRILQEIVVDAIWREAFESVSAPEPGDDHLWRLLKAHQGSVLITGDRLLLDNPPDFASVLSPRSFVDSLKSPT